MSTFDLSTLGIDVNLGMSDLAGVWGQASGLTNLGNAWVRRLACDPGDLDFGDGDEDEQDYGYNVIRLLNATLSAADIAKEESACAAEIEKDDRCDSCTASFNFDAPTGALFISLRGILSTGAPFQFVIAAQNLTVALFSVNGVLTQGSAIAAATQPGSSIQLVVGPPGPSAPTVPGPPGPPGPTGTAQVSLDFDEDIGADNTGAEVVVYQRLVDFDALGVTVTFELVANVLSAAGTATFKMSYGGTSRVADGTQVGSSMTTGSASFVPLSVSASISNPTGKKLVKITITSSGAAVDAQMADRVLTIR